VINRSSAGFGPVERAGPGDLAMRAMSARASVQQQLGALLLLEAGPGFDVSVATQRLAERIHAVPRLRQRLVHPPPGAGGPVWLDDAAFDVRRHVQRARCPTPGDEQALLDLTAALAGNALPRDRPLWSATFVTGISGGRVALLVVVHHVLVDGIGGLAVLAALVDPPSGETLPAFSPQPFPRPRPTYAALAADAARSKLRALRRLPAAVRALRRATAAAGGLHPPRAQRCSLLGRTGSRSRFAVARTDLVRLRSAAHGLGGTVNDALLAAIAGALGSVLDQRGESVETVVAAVMVTGRRSAAVEQLGNAATPLLVAVPTDGDVTDRLQRIAGTVRAARATAAGPSVIAVLGPLFRMLAVAGLYRWYMTHQRRFHTLVSNVPGPDRPLAFGGAPIDSIVPVGVGDAGNVTVSFLALSYAGTLTVTVIADPEALPESTAVAARLQAELDAVVSAAAGRG
jgi:diacylglycerol O-acyltransferase